MFDERKFKIHQLKKKLSGRFGFYLFAYTFV